MSVPAAFAVVVLIWSTTPLGVKWSSSADVSFLEGVTLRMLVAAVLASALLRALRIRRNYSLAAWRMHGMAALGFFGAMLIVYWAAQYVPSALIALMFGVAPLFAGVFGHWLLGERTLTPLRIASLFFALGGLALIFHGEIQVDARAAPALAGLVLATMMYALSGALIKRYRVIMHPLAQTSGSLWVTAGGFLLVWLISDAQVPVQIDSRTLSVILYLAVFGSILAFMLYFYLLNALPVTTVSLIPLLTPPMALVIGWAWAEESVTVNALVGGVFTLLSLALYQWGDRGLRRLRSTG